MHTIIDVSHPVTPASPEWPGDTPYTCGWTWSMASGATVNVSSLTMSPHVGTHADAPIHVRDGAPAVEALPLDAFAGPAYVLGIEGDARDVTFEELSPLLPSRLERLLLRTGVGIHAGEFPEDWPAPDSRCVLELVARGVRLLGTDAPSVDRRHSTTLEAHHALFGAGACNLENLKLEGIPNGWYELTAFPVLLAGLDAAPVRAVLRPLPHA